MLLTIQMLIEQNFVGYCYVAWLTIEITGRSSIYRNVPFLWMAFRWFSVYALQNGVITVSCVWRCSFKRKQNFVPSISDCSNRDCCIPIAFSFFACFCPSRCSFICGCDVTDMLQIWQYLSGSVSVAGTDVEGAVDGGGDAVVVVVEGVSLSDSVCCRFRNDSPILNRPVGSTAALVCL